MPIPKPSKEEDKKIFISRCMSDEIMKKEYKQEQRLAICYRTYETAKKIKKSKGSNEDPVWDEIEKQDYLII